MRRLYEAPAYEAAPDPGNLWQTRSPPEPERWAPLREEIDVDHVVIGGGVTGLSAARRLGEDHGRSVAVLEAVWPAWGASGRAGGFVCLGGSKLTDAQLMRRYGRDEAVAFHRFQRDAVEGVEAFLAARGQGPAEESRGEMMLAHRRRIARGLAAEAEALNALYGLGAQALNREALAERGMAGPEFQGGLYSPIGFAADPRAYALALLEAAEAAGARVFGRSAALSVAPEGEGVRARTAAGEVRARSALIAVNGYGWEGWARGLEGATLPAFSSVLATRPLTAAERAAQGWTSPVMAYDARTLLHYFRLTPEGRFVFGARGGVSARPAAQAAAKARLRRDFERMFPSWAAVPATHAWSGLVCLTAALTPFIGDLEGPARGAPPRLAAALGYHGNGLAVGFAAGRAAADLLAGALRADDLPAPLRGPLRRFSAPALRRLALGAAYLAAALEDERP